MDIKEIYKQLTGVEIEEQKKLWDERGKGYYGEFLVFTELYKNIKGNCKILMNLEVPTSNGKTTEIDLLMIHETGIYVFEIKHYKGDIYGKGTDDNWTQFFKTVKNNPFKNPFVQNAYHISNLGNLVPNIPLFSVVTFTSEYCDLHITNLDDKLCLSNIYNLNRELNIRFNQLPLIFSMEQIDEIFNNLSQYSKMQEVILYDGKEESFISWLQPTLLKLNEEKENYNQATIKVNNDSKKFKSITIVSIIIGFIILILSIYGINIDFKERLSVIESNYNTELDKFKQNFKHVDEIDNDYIKILNDYFNVSEVTINPLANDGVTLSAKITRNNDVYGMQLNEDSKYIVMTKDGMTYEYNIFGEHLKYNILSNRIGKGIRDSGTLATAYLLEIKKENISYIKINNITLFKLDSSKTVVSEYLDFELYSTK